MDFLLLPKSTVCTEGGPGARQFGKFVDLFFLDFEIELSSALAPPPGAVLRHGRSVRDV